MRFAVPLMALLVSAGAALADDRTVTDDAGRQVVVPERPQRIVVMHEPLLGVPLIELGMPVIGSYGRNDDGSFVTATDFIDVVLGEGHVKPKGIGPVGQIDDADRPQPLDADQQRKQRPVERDAGFADQHLVALRPVHDADDGEQRVMQSAHLF